MWWLDTEIICMTIVTREQLCEKKIKNNAKRTTYSYSVALDEIFEQGAVDSQQLIPQKFQDNIVFLRAANSGLNPVC